LKRLAVLNLKEYDGQGTRGLVKHSIKAGAGSTWVVKRLTADGAKSSRGITFNGFQYEAESVGTPVKVTGRASDEVVRADAKGNVAVSVWDSEAVVLVRK
jgi:hypothetical protein